MMNVDFIIVGGGVAGLSAAYNLSKIGKVVVLEREESIGYHSSGRSASLFHLGIGNSKVKSLTYYSNEFFQNPGESFSEIPLTSPSSLLLVVRPGQEELIESELPKIREFSPKASIVDIEGISKLVPVISKDHSDINIGIFDESAYRLDAHALLQGYSKGIKKNGGLITNNANVNNISQSGSTWQVQTEDTEYVASILINAAGAWGDELAKMANVEPIGLSPLKRTLISFDPPEDSQIENWPFVRSLAEEFYFLPESGRILASPADETPITACDAQPDEYDIALAAYRIEEMTSMAVKHIHHKWSGLRTFSPDRVPVAGFDDKKSGFFWLVGQGGYGLQTAPAMADITSSLISGADFPARLFDMGITSNDVSPSRFR